MKFPTPYIREPRDPDLPRFQITRRETNYSDYDIFLLPLNLYPYIRPDLVIDLEEGPVFTLEDDDGNDNDNRGNEQEEIEDYASRYYVVLTDEEGLEPIMTEDEMEDVLGAIDAVCTIKDNLALVFSYDLEIRTEDYKRISKPWINAMLPYLPSYKGIQGTLKEFGLYIYLNPEKDYQKFYFEYQEFAQDWLVTMYEKGSIPTIYTESFLDDWNLNREKGFFRPMKLNPAVYGNDPIAFFNHHVHLNEEMGKKYIWTKEINDRDVGLFKRFMDERGFAYKEDQGRFLIPVDGYFEANRIMQLFHAF